MIVEPMIDENCALCMALQKEKKLAYFTSDNEMGDGDWFYILPTKNKKGHKRRFQVIYQNHGIHVPEKGEVGQPMVPQDGKNLLFQYMLQFGEDFAILEPDFASIPTHWHLVATTLEPGDDEALVAKTRRIEIRFVKPKVA